MITTDNDFDILVSKALDSSLSKSDSDKLNAALKGNLNYQRRYCNFILQESLIHWESPSAVDSNEKVVIFPFWTLTSSIAAVLICMFSAWFIHGSFNTEIVVNDQASPISSPLEINTISTSNSNISNNLENLSFSSLPLHSLNYINSLAYKLPTIDGASISFENELPAVTRDDELGTSSIKGVLPLKDNQMIHFNEMVVDTTSQTAEITETLRVYDLKNPPAGFQNFVDASVSFNQSYSETSSTTEFSLSLHAVDDQFGDKLIDVGSTSHVLNSDNDLSTWERIDTSFAVPEGTDYLVVSLTAKKYGPSALTSHMQSFFADELELTFIGI